MILEIIIDDRQRDLAVNDLLIEELCSVTLKKEEVHMAVEVSVSLVSADEMTQINKRYRKIDKATDVLAFCLTEGSPVGNLLGDVVLCPSEAYKKATELSIEFNEYFGLLIIHAILHLLGYSHEHEMDAKVMTDKEHQLLREFSSKKEICFVEL